MIRTLLSPKVDFVFKKIFGSEENKSVLISFLNATLKPKKEIVSVDLKNTDIEKEYLKDKFSRLDVKAATSNKETIKDRKSTRLNSSHVAISYAVFCLKQQKINVTFVVSGRQ